MIEQEFRVGDRPEIDVHLQSGRVEVKEGPSGTIRVQVDTSDPRFTVEQRGDLVVVSSDRTGGWLSRESSFVLVEAPKGSDATISCASAKVDCRVALGRVDIKTASGDVEVEEAETLNVKTASGDTRVGSVTGDLRVASASGDTQVRDCRGKASCSSASGDVYFESLSAMVSVSTASGDITISRFTGREADLKSMSGTARVGVPAGTRLDLDASVLSGRLNLPERSAETPPVSRSMSIRAKLMSGDLTIHRIDD